MDSNRRLPQYQRSSYRIYPIVGIAQQTKQSARLAGGRVEMLETHKGRALSGDGTVPQVSAIPIELSDTPNAMYAATKHGSLQNAEAVITNMAGILSGLDLDLGSFRKPRTHVAIEIDDVYLWGQAVVLRARPTREATLKAVFWRTGDATRSAELAMVPTRDGWVEAEFVPAVSGGYHVAVGGADVETAQDLCGSRGDHMSQMDQDGTKQQPLPRFGLDLSWDRNGSVLVISGDRSLQSVIQRADRNRAAWIVVVYRRGTDICRYAYRAGELRQHAVERPAKLALPIEDALNLHEAKSSISSRGGRPLGQRQGRTDPPPHASCTLMRQARSSESESRHRSRRDIGDWDQPH